MDTKMIAVIAVVGILLVAGVAVFATSGGDDDEKINIDKSNGLGYVYGNADGDFQIDADDVKLIKQLSKETDDTVIAQNLEKFPLADVNRDGKIDGADADLAQMIVDGKATEVTVIDDTETAKTVSYPMKDLLVTGGTNCRVAISVLQMEDKILANATNKYIGATMDKVLYEKRQSGEIKIVTTEATADDMAIISQLPIKGVIVEEGGMDTYGQGAPADYFKSKDIEPLVMNFDNLKSARTTISTLGILVGAEERAESYVKFMDSVEDTINTTLVDKKGTTTVMTIVMSNSVTGVDSDYFKMSELAGGKNLGDWSGKPQKFDPSKGQTWLYDEKYNPDCLIHTKSMVYGEEVSESDLNKYKGYFDQTNAYKSGDYYLMNGTMPLPARIAYMASLMYPDEFEAGWAESVLQQYFDEFSAQENFDVKTVKAVWTTADF